ncbi:hypothetical protein [Maricaulis sp.]|uniref:hypothetical protein n=1 Tax=Maricaulis sp. TaxID=1486257 RepID=UPI003A94A5EC
MKRTIGILIGSALAALALAGPALADCVRSDITEERSVATTFRAADHNSITSSYDLRPTFASLCLSDGSVPDGDFVLFEIDTYGGTGYSRFAVRLDDAPELIDDLQTFLRWHAIAAARGDVFERDISVDSDARCRHAEYLDEREHNRSNQRMAQDARRQCELDRANSYGFGYAYYRGVFVKFQRSARGQSVGSTITPDQVPELIRVLADFISGELEAETLSQAELDATYQ